MTSHKRNSAAPAGTSGRSPRRRRTASGHLIGYARVSTDDQNLALQLDALKQAGCGRVFSDVGSGSLSHRPELDACLQFLSAGDTLVVWRLDRLGRGLKHLIEAIENLHDGEIGFRSLTEQIDTTTSAGRYRHQPRNPEIRCSGRDANCDPLLLLDQRGSQSFGAETAPAPPREHRASAQSSLLVLPQGSSAGAHRSPCAAAGGRPKRARLGAPVGRDTCCNN